MRYFEICLTDLHFHSHHGVFPQETKVGNEFIVDICIKIPYVDSICDDNLSDTVSYADVYEIVKEEMLQPRKLLECVASRIQSRLEDKCPQIMSGYINICKTTPPVSGITGNALVRLIF